MSRSIPALILHSVTLTALYKGEKVATCCLMLLLVSANAQAANTVVIDFDQLSASPPRANELFGDVDDPYREDGFLLTTPQSALRSVSSSFYAGSIAVFNEYLDGVTILRAESNQPFAMVSAKFSRLTNDADITSQFTGVTPLGQLVTTSFTRLKSSPLVLTTEFFPPSFSNVVEVRWVDPGNSNAMQVDDLTMSLVPEPSAGVLGVSYACVFAMMRRRLNQRRARNCRTLCGLDLGSGLL